MWSQNTFPIGLSNANQQQEESSSNIQTNQSLNNSEEYFDENASHASQDYANSSSDYGNSNDSRRRYRCNICSNTFPWHGDLTEHLRVEHGVTKIRENVRGGKAGSFCCSKCKYVAKYQSELKRHMRLHLGVKPFICEFCNYKSAWKGDLKRHMESHHKGCFGSDHELNKIMAKFKNNAGTSNNTNHDDLENLSNPNDSQKSSDNSIDIMATSSQVTNSISSGSETTSSSRGVKQCTQCNYSTQNENKMDLHYMECHGMKKVFECSVCHLKSDHRNFIAIHLKSFHNDIGTIIDNYTQIQQVVVTTGHQTTPATTVVNEPIKASPLLPDNCGLQPLLANPFNNLTNGILPDNPQIHKAPLLPQNLLQLLTNALINNNKSSFENMIKFKPETSQMESLNLTIPQGNCPLSTGNTIKFNPELTSSPTNVFFPIMTNSTSQSDDHPLELTINKRTSDLEMMSMTNTGRRSSNTPTSGDDQWKRFKCSACGHRSNWKWDINKHIRVAHPERTDIENVTMDIDEAKRTFDAYVEKTKFLKRKTIHSSNQNQKRPIIDSNNSSYVDDEGYFRPFKCTSCGHRSNWEWDIKRHIRNTHNGVGSVFKMTSEEAKKTIQQYKQQQRIFYAKIRQNTKRLSNKIQSMSEIKENAIGLPLNLSCNSGSSKFEEDFQSKSTTPEIKYKFVDKITAHMANRDFSAFKCPLCERWFNKWSTASLHFASHKNAKVPLSKLRTPRSIISRKSFPLVDNNDQKKFSNKDALSISIERIKLRDPIKASRVLQHQHQQGCQSRKRPSLHISSSIGTNHHVENYPAKRRQSLAPVSLNIGKTCLTDNNNTNGDNKKDRIRSLLAELNATLDGLKTPVSLDVHSGGHNDLNDSNEENKYSLTNNNNNNKKLPEIPSNIFQDPEIYQLWQNVNNRLKS